MLRRKPSELNSCACVRPKPVMNAKSELTTSEAAEVLNVSHRYLTELLEKGEIPFREKEGRRLMPRKEVLDYKRRQRERAEEAMQKLTDLSQELGLGY